MHTSLTATCPTIGTDTRLDVYVSAPEAIPLMTHEELHATLSEEDRGISDAELDAWVTDLAVHHDKNNNRNVGGIRR